MTRKKSQKEKIAERDSRRKQRPGKRNREKRNLSASLPIDREQEKRSLKHTIIYCVILFIIAFSVYAPTLSYEFAYDDSAVLTQNKIVQEGVKGIGDIFSTHYFAGYDPTMASLAYRPIPLVILAMQYEVSGTDPLPYHLVNILIYCLVGLILFFTLNKMFIRQPLYLPFLISLLFIVHPIHSEVIANIKSRDEMLGFLFSILALFLLFEFTDKNKWILLFSSFGAYFLALISKESSFTFLAVFPLSLYFFREMPVKKIAKVFIPYGILFGIFFLVRHGILSHYDSSSKIIEIGNPLQDADTLSERLGTSLLIFGKYLLNSFIPVKLVGDYTYKSIPIVSLYSPLALGSLLLHVVIIYYGIKGIKKKNPVSFAIFYYFITISFVVNGLIVGYNAYADRFLFSASLGPCILVGLGLFYMYKRNNENFSEIVAGPKLLVPAVVLVILVTLGIYRTETYLPSWKNDLNLFEYSVKQLPENARMRKNLGGEYSRMAVAEKDTIRQRQLAEKAVEQLEIGLKIYPRQPSGWVHLGNCYILLNNYPEAEKALENALSINPNNRFARGSLANVCFRERKYEDAIKWWESIDPRYLTKNNFKYISISYNLIGNPEKAAYYKKLSE